MTIKPLFAWYDFWVGAFWDRKGLKLYILPLPMVGVVIQFPVKWGPTMFDVVAVSIKTGKVRLLAQNKSERNAEAVVMMAVARRGVEEEFFTEVPAGKYHDGDTYQPAQ